MSICVEPLDGPELDRLVTALLNVTGAVHQIVERELARGEGLTVIDRSAERLREILAVVAEHHSDDELRTGTQFLAITTMLIADEEGFGEVFRADLDDPEDPVHADRI